MARLTSGRQGRFGLDYDRNAIQAGHRARRCVAFVRDGRRFLCGFQVAFIRDGWARLQRNGASVDAKWHTGYHNTHHVCRGQHLGIRVRRHVYLTFVSYDIFWLVFKRVRNWHNRACPARRWVTVHVAGRRQRRFGGCGRILVKPIMSYQVKWTHWVLKYTYRCGRRRECRYGGYTGCSGRRPVIFFGGEGIDTRICVAHRSTVAACTRMSSARQWHHQNARRTRIDPRVLLRTISPSLRPSSD